MSRMARDFSWHFVALTLVVAGLALLAPMTFWQARQPLARERPIAQARRFDIKIALAGQITRPIAKPTIAAVRLHIEDDAPEQPQVAEIRPPIADEITLDPSISETPALPAARTLEEVQPLLSDPTSEPRISAVPKPVEALTPDLRNLPPLHQPGELPVASPPANVKEVLPITKAWPYPAGLIDQLQGLTETSAYAPWAARVRVELDRLMACQTLADRAAAEPLVKLKELADAAKGLAQSQRDDQARSKLLRCGYALVRRLVIWDQVQALSDDNKTVAAPIVDRQAWIDAVKDVDVLLKATGAAANWRNYLLIDRAIQEFDSSASSPADQRRLARDILHRMRSTQLSHDQEQFLKTPPFAALSSQLAQRAAENPDYLGLLAAIEQYERDDGSVHCQALAMNIDALRWSRDSEVRELADSLNAYYRNANVRVAISSEMVNRILPKTASQVEPVGDVIQGAWVSGQSHTNTQLKLTLLPDKHRWNIGLEAVGQVASNTSSTKGPARFYQDGWSFFRARKRLTVDRRGIRMFNAEAEANANNSLNEFETDFDGIPLLGGIARTIARNQYDTSQPAAKVEVEGKIIVRATSQLDREVADKLERAKRDFQVKLVDPLRKLSLEPTAVDMETTADRLIARYRVAGRDQISAHTPRPQAPSDSLLSVQVHETALNNVLENLKLSGRRIELRALYKEMATRFRNESVQIPEDFPHDVYVTFADEDPVRLDCQDGLVRLTIRLKELSQGTRNRWTDFTVRGYYAPSADQLDANLVREGIIELIGDDRPLPVGQRIALSGIFNRVLSRNRKLNIINKQIAGAPELRDQQVTQFVIHDGWIGVALGPKAPGRQVAMQPRPRLPEVNE